MAESWRGPRTASSGITGTRAWQNLTKQVLHVPSAQSKRQSHKRLPANPRREPDMHLADGYGHFDCADPDAAIPNPSTEVQQWGKQTTRRQKQPIKLTTRKQ